MPPGALAQGLGQLGVGEHALDRLRHRTVIPAGDQEGGLAVDAVVAQLRAIGRDHRHARLHRMHEADLPGADPVLAHRDHIHAGTLEQLRMRFER